MVAAQASSLHSQMYGFAGPVPRVSFDCWIHSLISRDWVSFRTSCSRQSVTVGQRQSSSALRMAEVWGQGDRRPFTDTGVEEMRHVRRADEVVISVQLEEASDGLVAVDDGKAPRIPVGAERHPFEGGCGERIERARYGEPNDADTAVTTDREGGVGHGTGILHRALLDPIAF